ncbi:uncharacterized protein LOC119135428 [Syngnathus acus]|uniref:uncharacterized protein LOC119135428 n=1 Tax=Syngnathus acus TaxID=161584 RepID=UPI001885F79E|nr:uncharacterized protein LOC119135428 [Syngnathus acus]
MTEFAPFRLIVVNAEKVNTVSLEGDNITKEVELEPHHAAQFWLDGNEVWRVVRAKHPVAVLFGHPCAATLNCGCSMLYVTLNPKPHCKMAFLVPPLLSQASEDQTALLLSQEDASSVDSSYPGWPLLELSGIAAVLHRPGLLLPLIPQSELASCYVVNAIPDVYNFAVILVHKDLARPCREQPTGRPHLANAYGDRLCLHGVNAQPGQRHLAHLGQDGCLLYRTKGGRPFWEPGACHQSNLRLQRLRLVA